MQHTFTTDRLILAPVTLGDAGFIRELVNSPGWIRFIGERNIHSEEAAKEYIQKLVDNPNINYWVVRTREEQVAIGIITFIKRDYLEHHDIGFAFLPHHGKQGYAYEATKAILEHVAKDAARTRIVATTKKDNQYSIRLLEKLGLQFDKAIQVEQQELLLYTLATDTLKDTATA